jgi:hypothetical protein
MSILKVRLKMVDYVSGRQAFFLDGVAVINLEEK